MIRKCTLTCGRKGLKDTGRNLLLAVSTPPLGSACLRWGPDSPDPGPGVMTMRRTLKRDIPQLLTQRRGRKSMGFVWRRNSGKHSLTEKPCPICLRSAALSDLTTGPVWSLLDLNYTVHVSGSGQYTKPTARATLPTFLTLYPSLIYWIGRLFSAVIDIPPDAVGEEDTF
ncbi:hypothetical protein KUCAC02_026328 [Chaenocephalus aceratus]|uniref:Uncharacterized protein n=1 Tax=Chaenocephalus aceratus TaxID=36190 RepID=A0ACB9VWB1_CHAAC|nr:hypothetical protein KUCAC02_026328 [Chaenocephalus aceratus]